MVMHRRRFLEGCGIGLSALLAETEPSSARALAGAAPAPKRGEIAADVVIIGGGVGGCAAALAAARAGRTVVLAEPTDWIGGQLTSQAVPPDEHPWIEKFGANASYQRFRRKIREYYRRNFNMTSDALADHQLNPGRGGVSKLCHEPRVAVHVLRAMLAPHLSAGRIFQLLRHEPVRAEVAGDRIRAVVVRNVLDGRERTLVAPYFLDASELGDLLPLAGVEFVTGFESRADTDEPHAPEAAQPDNQQAFTCCFAVEYRDGEDHTIDKPAEYGIWRSYIPNLDPDWPGKLLDLNYTHPVTLKPVSRGFDPTGEGKGLWVYRRIIDPRNFAPGSYHPKSTGVTLVNWPQNDYWLGNLIGNAVAPARFDQHVARAKQLSLSLLYWLQTECPRPDGGTGWKGLKLRPDVVGTDDGLAKFPYIRESRRIKADFTVTENHVGTEARRKRLGKQDVSAEEFPDTVGVGSYRIDLHPSSGGNNYIDASSLPFQIPLGALIPIRVENLLPACKNLGTTHITNGCYRLHPVEWGIGEAAGTLAAHCLETKQTPRGVRSKKEALELFQKRLITQGVELEWPDGLPPR
jgi:hypothetical protein